MLILPLVTVRGRFPVELLPLMFSRGEGEAEVRAASTYYVGGGGGGCSGPPTSLYLRLPLFTSTYRLEGRRHEYRYFSRGRFQRMGKHPSQRQADLDLQRLSGHRGFGIDHGYWRERRSHDVSHRYRERTPAETPVPRIPCPSPSREEGPEEYGRGRRAGSPSQFPEQLLQSRRRRRGQRRLQRRSRR